MFKFVGSRMKNQELVHWDRDLIHYLYFVQEAIRAHIPDMVIRTEHSRDGQIFRGSPNFRQSGLWNDWVVVDWGAGEGHLPNEIWCFVDLSALPNGVTLNIGDVMVQKGVYAVVESGAYLEQQSEAMQEIHATTSDLFRPFFKDGEMTDEGEMKRRKFYLADVDAFVEPVCVIPDVGNEVVTKYFQVVARKEWANIFTAWLEQPHHYDDMTDEE